MPCLIRDVVKREAEKLGSWEAVKPGSQEAGKKSDFKREQAKLRRNQLLLVVGVKKNCRSID